MKPVSLDTLFHHLDLVRKTLWVHASEHRRPYPASATSIQHSCDLTSTEKKHAAGLMRVNHTGEVCAQALYQGQAMTARSRDIEEKMQHAAEEEFDHLAWCQRRLETLGSQTSYLNIFWYFGALGMGIVAGCLGEKWNLGFLAETEEQVVRHLDMHLGTLPEKDLESRDIVKQMREDEKKHRDMAYENGAATLPGYIKKLMKIHASIMTRLVYYI